MQNGGTFSSGIPTGKGLNRSVWSYSFSPTLSSDLSFLFPFSVSFCTFLAHEYPDQVHKVVMINGGGPTALEPSLCSVFNLPTCVLHWMSPCLAWSFLM